MGCGPFYNLSAWIKSERSLLWLPAPLRTEFDIYTVYLCDCVCVCMYTYIDIFVISYLEVDIFLHCNLCRIGINKLLNLLSIVTLFGSVTSSVLLQIFCSRASTVHKCSSPSSNKTLFTETVSGLDLGPQAVIY